MIDKDLHEREVQDLSGPDQIAGFFAALRYNVDHRISQTPANLGITADTLIRQIRRVELVADQEGFLQVYLFELSSVTIAGTRALVRTFRNRGGNFLLVLTSDYERIDFVLVERLAPTRPPKGPMGQVQVTVRPRVFTVERRKPGRVHLRVLRRFTYTEGDPIAQYEKLLSAYAMADWSEDFFNNRALFSDYYLLERLRDHKVWRDDPKPVYQRFRDLYTQPRSRWAGRTEQELRTGLLVPAFEALGFVPKEGKAATDDRMEPDYQLYSSSNGSEPVVLCLTYPWGRFLDGKDDARDHETSEENPGASVVSLLEQGKTNWAIVTNGKHWRLYSAKAHSRSTDYYEIDLEEVLAQDDPAESFRYFWLLFRCSSFEPFEEIREGETHRTTLVDALLEGSEEYAKRLEERLKKRVFEQIFPHFAQGFIEYIRQRDGLNADLSQPVLDRIFEGALTFLYRLLFLLYAEARDLLPVKEIRGYAQKSLTVLKREVAQAAGDETVKAETSLRQAYRADCTELYDRLMDLFRTIDIGDANLNVPVYNGGLFLTEVDTEDYTSEAENARFLLQHKIPDRFLALGLELLSRDEDDKTFKRVFIDYKSLGVRQLGSIYEGLLEFKLRIAPERMAIVKGKKTEEIIPYREAETKKQGILTEGRGANAKERTLSKGTVYLENDRRERKATGSYYTPDYIVKYIVEHTVGPVLKEKFEAVTPKIREAQVRHRRVETTQKAFERLGRDPRNPALTPADRAVVDELFDIKVLDPAMGSGHFLVEAVDFITDRMVDFLNGFPWNPVFAMLQETRQTILDEMDEQHITIGIERLTDVNLLKRHVLKRCIYGVDLNPMAVELAKVSLWLNSFTLGAPLSFLDHHLKCGNSLIGAKVDEARKAIEGETGLDLFGSRFAGLMLATDLMRHVGELSDVTADQIRESRREYQEASDALAPFRRILDLYTSQWFGNGKAALGFLKTDAVGNWVNDPKSLDCLRSTDREVAEKALRATNEKRFFHWELEFPEVFYEKGREKETPGFGVVVGNPPYDEISEYAWGRETAESSYLGEQKEYQAALGGRLNLFRFFILRTVGLLRYGGGHSFIVPMPLLSDQFSFAVRKSLLSRYEFVQIHCFPQKDDPQNRVFKEAKLSTCVYALKNQQPHMTFSVCIYPGKYFENGRGYRTSHNEIATVHPEGWAIPLVDADAWRFLKKLSASYTYGRFEEAGDVYPGEIMLNAQFSRFVADESDGELLLRGAHIGRYELNENPKQGAPKYLNTRAYLEASRGETKAKHHQYWRIGFQRGAAIDNWRRLIGTLLEPDLFLTDTVGYILARNPFSVYFLLALFESKLLEWRFGLYSTTNHVNAYEVKSLPIRRIHFTTPEPERKRLVEELKRMYLAETEAVNGGENGSKSAGMSERTTFDVLLKRAETLLPKDENGQFLAFGEAATGAEEKSDVVHDLLAYLAEQMMELNKQKQAEMKRFLDWLEVELHIAPDQRGNTGIEALTGKTKLKSYLGDYQKAEEHLAFEELIDVLVKNRGRIGQALSGGTFGSRLQREYKNSLEKLLPIKTRLAKTDWLIDQIVYRLYGLTEEEIKIVERKQ